MVFDMISSLYAKLFHIAAEIKGKFCPNQHTFQRMCRFDSKQSIRYSH